MGSEIFGGHNQPPSSNRGYPSSPFSSSSHHRQHLYSHQQSPVGFNTYPGDKSPATFASPSPATGPYPRGSFAVDGESVDGMTDHEIAVAHGRSASSRGRQSWPEMSDTLHKITGLAVGFGTVVTDCLISHPCHVVRYQCQINGHSRIRHLTPFTLMPFCYNVARHQGIGVLWKGVTSSFVTRGVCFAVETALSDFCHLPKEVTRVSSAKKVSQHLLLKMIAFGVATPFMATNFVELVQSAIATDQSSVADYWRDTMFRLSGRGHLATTGARLLPIYVLVVPTVCFHLAHYCISTLARVTTLSLQRQHYQTGDSLSGRSISVGDRFSMSGSVGNVDQSGYDSDPNSVASSEPSGATVVAPDPVREMRIQQQRCLAELLAVFTGNLMADLVLYPVQTILHRLYIQGTRTIVDSTDNGLEVLAISTRYLGFFDCAQHIYREEGIGGYFRGFGALVLQYSLQALLLRIASSAFDLLTPPSKYSHHGMYGDRRRSRRYR